MHTGRPLSNCEGTINFVKEEHEEQRRELDDEEDELQKRGRNMKIVRT
jgi:23S rRNA maturation mini-RNase III